jgi:Kef-type K+ transport system membrane component KefB
MFSAGLEIDLAAMLKVGRSAAAAGGLGVLVPLLITAASTLVFGYSFDTAVFIGLILAATSVSISAQVMLELRVLRTPEGLALLGAAVIDDILVILLISLFIAVNPGTMALAEQSRSILEVLVRMVGFLTLATGIGWVALPRIAQRIHRTPISEGVLMVAVAAALLLGFSAEFFGGVAPITGAFIAGICLARSDHRIVEEIARGLHRLSYAFFVPIFFISIGLQANLRLLDGAILPLALVLTVGAIIGKIMGSGLGGLLTGFNRISALRLGIGMVSRGEVGLIVAAIGISRGIISQQIFAAVVLVVLVTTLITPPLVRWSFTQEPPKPKTPPSAAKEAGG